MIGLTVRVRFRWYALAILFTTCAPTYAQTGVTGTWRVEGVGSPFPWEVVLRADGAKLTGVVSSCFSGPTDILQGTLTGNIVRFQCKNLPVNDRTITLNGRIDGDEIAFDWALQVKEGSIWASRIPIPTIFSSSAPARFTAKRVPDSQLAQFARQTRGTEFSAAVNLPDKDVKLEGTLFLPEKVRSLRAVIITAVWGLGRSFYSDPKVRELLETTESGLLLARFSNIGPSVQQNSNMFNEDGADGLLLLLRRLAQESKHPELTDAPFLFWGHSAAGVFGASVSARHAQRAIAFVLYHSGGVGVDPPRAWSQIPTLIFEGAKDTITNGGEDFWMRGRSGGAPWTFALEPDATHGDSKDLEKANDLLIPWITAVFRQRLSQDGTGLREVTERSALMGNNRSGEVAPYSTFAGSKVEASWLPDQASARGWQTVLGVAK